MPTIEDAKTKFCRICGGAAYKCIANECMHWIEGVSPGYGDCAFTIIAKSKGW